MDCSVGFRTGGTCGHRMLAFHRSVPSFPLSPSHSPPTLLPLLILLFLIHPSPFREWHRRGAAGRLRRPLRSGGAATAPGTVLGPGGCHPRGRPGLSRAPARTPQSPKSHWEVWVGKARNEGGGSKGRSLPWRLKLMGTRRQGEGSLIMERFLGEPSLLGEGLDRGTPFRIQHCLKVEGAPV